ncbi:DUF4124 domain-containing protein [Pseudocolwellia sp. AS88]|uniref:DUF4124 domain-containing protein n=1 Tax=Pseudocolwellia sp. AS88 TaxID=3063958 RepID=UPI0026EAE00C|nr:DUF4124 domain-containing protein [Pseudocolwellia sp. AS88]MDO7086580.1 DUF4124 domain-containing protein [Pseudocolwellia sp. AS88]
MKYWSTSLLLLLSLNALADVIIYRWVGEDGVVHFSQNQPAEGNYTELVMANAQLSNLDRQAKPAQKQEKLTTAAKEKEAGVSENLTLDISKKCEEAKKNLATLTDFNRIRFVDADGNTQILNEEEQKEQITINQERVDLYCKS